MAGGRAQATGGRPAGTLPARLPCPPAHSVNNLEHLASFVMKEMGSPDLEVEAGTGGGWSTDAACRRHAAHLLHTFAWCSSRPCAHHEAQAELLRIDGLIEGCLPRVPGAWLVIQHRSEQVSAQPHILQLWTLTARAPSSHAHPNNRPVGGSAPVSGLLRVNGYVVSFQGLHGWQQTGTSQNGTLDAGSGPALC